MQLLVFASVCAAAAAGELVAGGAAACPNGGVRKSAKPSLTRQHEAAGSAVLVAAKRGGGRGSAAAAPAPAGSIWWAVFHNWLSLLCLGLTIPVLGRVISTIVNADGSPNVSPASAVLGGDVESLDKLITFLFVGFHGALSDVVGRKPLMAWSALGFASTCLIQATVSEGVAAFYIADLVDGVSSCMGAVCQAYVTDVSPPARRAVNLGVFQGVSVAGAFILGFPLSAVLDAKYGLRAPLYAAAALGFANFLIIALLTPESLPPAARAGKRLDLRSANPLGALRRLFCTTPLLRRCATGFALAWLGNMAINSQFGNYANHLFQWGPQESAPVLVLIGLMIGVAPPLLIPRLGVRRAIQAGALVYAAGLLAISFARSAGALVGSVLFMALGCIAIPALVSLIAEQAPPAERGAMLGALQTLQDLCDAAAFSGYGRLFARSIQPPANAPGAVFVLAAGLLLAFFGVMQSAFAKFPEAAATLLRL